MLIYPPPPTPPFLLEIYQLLNGVAHGVMLMNSNAMDVVLEPSAVTFKTTGGIIDLYVFSGSTPTQVVQQYTALVGRPIMFPYWSFGFHNCHWGYSNLAEVEGVVTKYREAGIPLETQWMDIDYMQDYRDFTYDAVKFPSSQVKSFIDTLHANGQKFVPIVDPGISVTPGYEAYERGVKEGLFIRDITQKNYLGQVWPGATYFPDFMNPNIGAYWRDMLQSFYDLVPMDGLWIDMNEVSNFCNDNGKSQSCELVVGAGSCPNGCLTGQGCVVCKVVDSTNTLDFPPYQVRNIEPGYLPSSKTVAMSALHYNNVTHYNAHNLYGISEQIATNAAMTAIRNKRPFVLSRSSFLSTGTHSAKWTGDNAATWDDLKSSIISVMDFNLFGVPMIGADICGFNENTNEELCARWIEVGAFYPFSRDHYSIGTS